MPVVEVKNLTKRYGNRRGVGDVSLTVEAGQIYGFLGPNGAGKSTTIRLLLGFLKADSGQASILNQNCWNQSHNIKQDVGYVPGDVRLYPWLTAEKAFDIVGSIRHCDLRTEGRQLAEQFRLEPHLPVRKMSRGNRQKLSLVMALVHKPKLLILDEPTSGLDPLIQDVLMESLKSVAQQGSTVFFSSHTLSEVEAICEHVAVIKDGAIVVDERLDVLQSQAPRTVELKFANSFDPDSASIPAHARMIQQEAGRLTLRITGSSADIVRWAGQLPITDVSISSPKLEDLFRQYYQTTEAATNSHQQPSTAEQAS